MRFVLPMSLVAHDRNTYSGSLSIEVEYCKFNTVVPFVMESITQGDDIDSPRYNLIMEIPVRFKPHVMKITCNIDTDYVKCIIYNMRSFKEPDREHNSYREDPVRTLTQKHNGVEIAYAIPNLHPSYDFKSWANCWMGNGDRLEFRFFCDGRVHKAQRREDLLATKNSK